MVGGFLCLEFLRDSIRSYFVFFIIKVIFLFELGMVVF